jgi:hypothetical protein
MSAPSREDDVIQVVVHPVLRPALEDWLDRRGWELWRMPDFVEDDLPTYSIRPKEAL